MEPEYLKIGEKQLKILQELRKGDKRLNQLIWSLKQTNHNGYNKTPSWAGVKYHLIKLEKLGLIIHRTIPRGETTTKVYQISDKGFKSLEYF